MAAGSGLLKAKGLDSNAVPGSVIAAPELSKNLDNDKIALKEYNSLLAYGATPAEAYAESLMGVSKALRKLPGKVTACPLTSTSTITLS